ncbi:MAG: hypothetical protein NTV51_11595 [Verrucomicrobia bacterium]|nr:hypothetical protein [Verrucomicrobiota bacterium]
MPPTPLAAPWCRLAFASIVAWSAAPSVGYAGAEVTVAGRSESGAIIRELGKAEEKVKAAKGEQEISMAAQGLAAVRATVGDYAGALAAFREQSGHLPELRLVEAREVQAAVEGYEAIPALEAIVAAARDRQVVILNEAHHVSRHRAFAQLLAARLREIGFEYLACETFSARTDDLQKRGYVTTGDGYYTREPLFADFVRQSLKLGYIPVAYEIEGSSKRTGSAADSINERETVQAANLVKRILAQKPKARVFIYVGYSHLMKAERSRPDEPGRTVQWMAGRLKAATGIDPLTIDQVAMTDPEPDTLPAGVLERVFSPEGPKAPAVVLQRGGAKPGHLVLGTYQGDAEMQVFHRPTKYVQGRPDWLGMGGYRKPQEIPAELLPKTGRRLIKALVEGEGESAIAMDQVVVTAGEKSPPVLMLPAGRFRLVYEE